MKIVRSLLSSLEPGAWAAPVFEHNQMVSALVAEGDGERAQEIWGQAQSCLSLLGPNFLLTCTFRANWDDLRLDVFFLLNSVTLHLPIFVLCSIPKPKDCDRRRMWFYIFKTPVKLYPDQLPSEDEECSCFGEVPPETCSPSGRLGKVLTCPFSRNTFPRVFSLFLPLFNNQPSNDNQWRHCWLCLWLSVQPLSQEDLNSNPCATTS